MNAQFQRFVHEIHREKNALENNPPENHYCRFRDFNKKYSDFWSIINKKPPRADNDLQDYFLSFLCYTAFIENPDFWPQSLNKPDQDVSEADFLAKISDKLQFYFSFLHKVK